MASRDERQWGQAIEVPGPGGPEQGRAGAAVSSVSCASAGNCAAGGDYRRRPGHLQGFVVDEKNGVWDQAIEVPGLGALNKGGDARVDSMSCASPGNCAAGGALPGQRRSSAGVRGQPEERRLGPGDRGARPGRPEHRPVRRGRLGVVRLGGQLRGRRDYRDQQHHTRGFVVREQNGVWGPAAGVPGLGALNKAGDAAVSSVSCAPGSCEAGGYYVDRSRPRRFEGFVTE